MDKFMRLFKEIMLTRNMHDAIEGLQHNLLIELLEEIDSNQLDRAMKRVKEDYYRQARETMNKHNIDVYNELSIESKVEVDKEFEEYIDKTFEQFYEATYKKFID